LPAREAVFAVFAVFAVLRFCETAATFEPPTPTPTPTRDGVFAWVGETLDDFAGALAALAFVLFALALRAAAAVGLAFVTMLPPYREPSSVRAA
jgi:hypothetical protein